VCDYELLIENEGNKWWGPILKRARIVLETEGNLKKLLLGQLVSERNFESSGEVLYYM
jgi:hypothetical protein